MSNRSLIEINHDFAYNLGDEFLLALRYYLTSANRETARHLELFGVHVISRRHHSGRYYVDPRTDGFPVQSPLSAASRTLEEPESAAGAGGPLNPEAQLAERLADPEWRAKWNSAPTPPPRSEAEAVQNPRSDLIERLRAHVRYEYMPRMAREAMEEAADALSASPASPSVGGWRDIADHPPWGEKVILLTQHGRAFVGFWGETVEDEEGRDCATWAAAEEGQHPPCWTDGLCWAQNEDGWPSDPPVAWMPLPAPHRDADGLKAGGE